VVTWPAGIWHSRDQTLFSKGVRLDAAMRRSWLSIGERVAAGLKVMSVGGVAEEDNEVFSIVLVVALEAVTVLARAGMVSALSEAEEVDVVW